MSEDIRIWFESDMECNPLDSIKDIQVFMYDPPAWRSLCAPLQPHSKKLIRNCELVRNFNDIDLERPETFCHYNPEKDHVKRYDENTLPKTLVCHDMANGYHDDKAIDGTDNYSAYTFYNWAAVDIFCYFSHRLVTIPPLGWINVAHAHGVKVIGTLITEWAEGVEFWKRILSSDTETHNMVSALVTIAKTLKFEGWLLNVENKILAPEKLLQFVKSLHKMLHDEVPNAVLIWYDSVTDDGNLNWQNKLNDKNRMFFEACDGLFTNYSWKEEDIEETVKQAGDRCFDVFVGIDVWGRNFFGGGKFNTQEAVKLVHSHGLSMAIFAPAWTHEAMNDEESSIDACCVIGQTLPPIKRYIIRDRALWGSLWPYLNTRVPCKLPFKTSFCRGLGKKRRMYGEVLCNSPWFNLRHMQYQPNSIHGPHGFLLSTKEKIKNVSRQTIRDVRGIMKFRQSMLELNQMMYEESQRIIERQQSETDLNRDTRPSMEVEEQAADQQVVERRHSMTEIDDTEKSSSLKTVFRQMFRFKKEKVAFKDDNVQTEQQPEQQPERESVDREAQSSSSMMIASTGRSMVHMPVRLHLGQVDERRLAIAFVSEERECLELYLEDSFNGGSCFRINPSDQIMEEHRTIRLFHCDFFIEDTLVCCLVTKNVAGFPSQFLKLKLHLLDKSDVDHTVVLVGRQLDHGCNQSTDAISTFYPMAVGDVSFKELQAYLVVNEPGFYMPIENAYGWKVFYFQVRLPGHRVLTAALRTGDLTGAVLLGHVGFCARDLKPNTPNTPVGSITTIM